MVIKLLELLAEHGGLFAVLLGIPYISLAAAVVILWKNSNKDKERLLEIIESKVEQDAQLEAAFVSLKELIQSHRGQP